MGQAGRWQERVVATSSPARLLAGHHTQRGGVRMRCSPIKAQIHQCPAWLKCVAHHVFVTLPRSWLSSGKKKGKSISMKHNPASSTLNLPYSRIGNAFLQLSL
ncbi:unnamed protein product [Urochloa humidicola]